MNPSMDDDLNPSSEDGQYYIYIHEFDKYDSEKYSGANMQFGVEPPRSPRAAFQFGFLTRKLRIDHAVHWAKPGSDRTAYRAYEVPTTVYVIKELCRNLAS